MPNKELFDTIDGALPPKERALCKECNADDWNLLEARPMKSKYHQTNLVWNKFQCKECKIIYEAVFTNDEWINGVYDLDIDLKPKTFMEKLRRYLSWI